MVELEAIAIAFLGAGGTLLGLVGLMRRRWSQHWSLQLAPLVIAGLAGALAWTSRSPFLAALPLALVGFWCVVRFGDAMLQAAVPVVAFVRRPAVAWGALLAASPLLAVSWSYWAVAPIPLWEPPQVLLIEKSEVAHGSVRTDAGRILHVAAPMRSATAAELLEIKHQTMMPNLICTDSPGVDYNCHGWVFTGGRYWIGGDDVKRILEDNGYRPVTVPAPGDVIIYYSGENPVHTGLVRASDERGIIIESKWDTRGRYIHLPESQDYSEAWVYYHTDRKDHIVAGVQPQRKTETVSALTSAGSE